MKESDIIVATRRALLGAGGLGALSMALGMRGAVAQEWQATRPLRMVLPYPPGGATDIVARMVAQKMAAPLKQTVVVENRAGGNGIVAYQAVMGMPVDGTAVLMATADTHTTPPHFRKDLPFNVNDFVPVSSVCQAVFCLAVSPKVPVKNMAELTDYAKKAKEPLTYASFGVGSISHAGVEMLRMMLGFEATHVPYQGAGPAVLDVSTGQVDFLMVPVAAVYPQRDKLRMLAVCSEERFPLVPEVPTMREQGVAMSASAWIGLVGAKGLPDNVANTIHAAVQSVLGEPELQDAFRTNGLTPQRLSRADFASYLKEEDERWGEIIRKADIKL